MIKRVYNNIYRVKISLLCICSLLILMNKKKSDIQLEFIS